jgi:hypothetical protein
MSAVNVEKERTSCSEEFLDIQTNNSAAPTSMPAHFEFSWVNLAGIVLEDFINFVMTSSFYVWFDK